MMMKHRYLICACALIAGMLMLSIHRNWIIIALPTRLSDATNHTDVIASSKKNVSLFYWHNHAWRSEKTTLIWHTNKAMQIHYLINSWLAFLDEEKIVSKRICVQSVMLTTADQEALISLDRSPFHTQSSSHEKMMLMESLLKTIRDNGIALQRVRILVHHSPLKDEHLDFTHAWPIHGFMRS